MCSLWEHVRERLCNDQKPRFPSWLLVPAFIKSLRLKVAKFHEDGGHDCHIKVVAENRKSAFQGRPLSR